MTCPSRLLDLITLTILNERYKLWSSSLWSLLHSLYAFLLGPNICLNILFSSTLILSSSFNVRDYASHPCSTTGCIIILYILIFKQLRRNQEQKSILIRFPLNITDLNVKYYKKCDREICSRPYASHFLIGQEVPPWLTSALFLVLVIMHNFQS